jgi:hypothetical protein
MWGNGQTGKYNGSLDFDSLDDAVTISANSNLNLTTGGTISVWIRPNSSGEGTFGRIIDKSTDSNNTGGWSIQMNGSAVMGQISGSTCTSSAISLSQWTHVVFTFDGTNWKLYINGVPNTTCAKSILPTGTSVGVTIGNRQGATDRTFDGLIDEVRVYNQALTAAQVAAIP